MLNFKTKAGGQGYVDIRVGGDQYTIHQALFDVSGLAASADADGMIPPGLPIDATGNLVTAGNAYGVTGPEPVYVGDGTGSDVFGNVLLSGVLNRDAIEDNLGRALTAAEVTGINGQGLLGMI